MKTDNKIPFYSNTPDNTHCFQAALKMLIGHYFPSENYSWEELDKITAKVKGLWTWPTAGLLWFQSKDVQIQILEDFDYQRFVDEGESYLLEHSGPEAGQAQIDHSDITQERRLLKEALHQFNIQKLIPTNSDLKHLLNDGHLIICLVNSMILNNKSGYVGHFVVVKGYQDNNLIIHDPGLPPIENRIVSMNDFEKAWASPSEKNKSIITFRKP